jgi:hypothetical protein
VSAPPGRESDRRAVTDQNLMFEKSAAKKAAARKKKSAPKINTRVLT